MHLFSEAQTKIMLKITDLKILIFFLDALILLVTLRLKIKNEKI